MKILAVECSAAPVSVAVSDGGKIISSAYSNIKLTHSQTLIPMADEVLKNAGLKPGDIEGFAVAAGPGSFTGVRIGIAAVKGMAANGGKKCFSVSTLYAMAVRFSGINAVICPVMDARCGQLYNALFKVSGGKIDRLTDDRAVLCEQLKSELEIISEPVIVCGDGSQVFETYAKGLNNISFAAGELAFQNAAGVALAANEMALNNEYINPEQLLPVYLRLPQAVRELNEKNKKE